MMIRRAKEEEVERLAEIERTCFPPKEAASEKSIKARMKVFPECFWVAETDDVIQGFINGAVLNQKIIDDEMYQDENCHCVDGDWQSVFGINTLPEYRKQGIGGAMLQALIDDARNKGRKGCILTCKDYLLHFYESYGFCRMGPSDSTHGGASWNDMILKFEEE